MNERRGKRYWPQIATAVLVPMLLLGMIEAALRLFGVGFPTELTVPCTVQGQAAACYNLFFPAPFFPPGMIKTPQAYAIPAEKPQGDLQNLRAGESAAMGDPDPAYGFSRYLEVMLRERYPCDEVRGGEHRQRRHQLARAVADRRGIGEADVPTCSLFIPATMKSSDRTARELR